MDSVKKKRTPQEERAYWMGVGASAYLFDSGQIMNGPYAAAFKQGYEDDNYHNVSDFMRHR